MIVIHITNVFSWLLLNELKNNNLRYIEFHYVWEENSSVVILV